MTTTTGLPAVPPLAAFLRPQLPEAAMYGLPGEIASTLSQATGADPAAVLVSFLTLLGNAAGPQPHARFGGADHPARLFAVLVGDAATGRKGTALGAVERLFTGADPEWAENRVQYGLQSAEAMIDRVADDYADDCRLMVVETEFGRLVETMARTGTLSAQLRNVWDGRTLQRATTRFTRRASRAHISMLAMITPEELLRHHRRLAQAGGLESRILYCFTAPAADISPFASAAPDGHEYLTDRVRQVLEASRDAVMSRTDPISRYLLTLRGIQPRTELPVSGDVIGGWTTLVKDRLPVPGEGFAGLHSRAESQVIRLASAYAIADMASEIRAEHTEAALGVLSYCARSAEIVFGVPVAQLPPRVEPRITAKIVRCLHDRYPDWVTRDDIGSGALHGNVPAADTAAALADLTAKRLIEHHTIGTAGRPRDEYRLVAPQLSLFPYSRKETPDEHRSRRRPHRGADSRAPGPCPGRARGTRTGPSGSGEGAGMTETPASTIQRAAARMRELASGCQPRRWHWEALGEKRYPQRVSSDGNAAIIAETYIDPAHRPFEAEHIASWHPIAAFAIAAWLESLTGIEFTEGNALDEWSWALYVARAYLGELPA